LEEYSENMQGTLREYLGNNQGICSKGTYAVKEQQSGNIQGSFIRERSQNILRPIQRNSEIKGNSSRGTFQECSGNIQGAFIREHCGNILGPHHSGNIQAIFREQQSGNIQGTSHEHSRTIIQATFLQHYSGAYSGNI
jgi:hypothetical protein